MEHFTDALLEEFEGLTEGNTDYAEKAFASGIITQKDIDECQFIYQLAQRIPGYEINGNRVSDSTRAKIIEAGKNHGFDMSKYTNSSVVRRKGDKIPTEEWFVKGVKRNGKWSIARLTLDLGWKYECDICHISEWEGKPISLQLHHKDGDHENNELGNLQLLCPNCHSQTPSYARIKNTNEDE